MAIELDETITAIDSNKSHKPSTNTILMETCVNYKEQLMKVPTKFKYMRTSVEYRLADLSKAFDTLNHSNQTNQSLQLITETAGHFYIRARRRFI